MNEAKRGGVTASDSHVKASLRLSWFLAQVVGCSIALAACGGGGGDQSTTSTGGTGSSPAPAPAPSPSPSPAPSPSPSPSPAPAPATSGTATLSWQAPQTKADGSALTDLAGYRIYYGTASGSYSSTITIADPSTTTYTIQNLAASNTYFFVLRAFDKNGLESNPTPEASKTIS